MGLSEVLVSYANSFRSVYSEYSSKIKISRTEALIATSTAGIGIWLLMRLKRKKTPPVARGLPILGNFLEVSHSNVHEDLLRLQQKQNLPDVFIVRLGIWNEMLVLNSYDAMLEALVTYGELFANRPPTTMTKDEIMFKDYLDPTWHEGKAFVMSLLRNQGFGNTKRTEEMIFEQVDELQALFETLIQNRQPVDIHDVMPKVSANIMFTILFNKRYALDDSELACRVKNIQEWYLNSRDAVTSQLLPHWIIKIFFRDRMQRFETLTNDIFSFIETEIGEHLKCIDGENPRDFVEGYLSKKKSPDDQEVLRDTIFTVLPDSVDTMAAIFNFVFLYLAHHPSVQDKAYAEIVRLTGGTQNISLADRSKLPYCEAIVLETMRVAVPVPITLLHCAIKDATFRGYRISPSLPVIGNIYAVLRDPEIFKDPKSFKPERFINEHGKLKKDDAWIPFGMGRRKCVGEPLTKAEVFLVATNLVQRYKFLIDDREPSPTLEAYNTGFSRVPKPFKLLLEPRM